MIDISIIIVNYNVKEFVYNLVNSIEKAQKEFALEIFVVDNASVDGSVTFLQSRFKDKLKIISSDENLGYGKAANIAFAKAKGKYTLLINPDTLIKEDTLQILFEFMEDHPEAGMAGCKLLNPDGSFAIDSRHSIPNVSSAFWRVTGLSHVFPKSKTFGDYNLTWMDENTQSQVPAISGAFMFCRTGDIHKLNGFDERFFMFCEDIDLCKRMNDMDRKIYFVPEATSVHYKGESTKRNSIDHVRNHGKSLYQFFDKYYGHRYSEFFRLFVILGIGIRAVFLYLRNLLKKITVPLIDITIINVLLFTGFWLRYTLKSGFDVFSYSYGFISIHLIISVFYLLFAKFNNLYRDPRLTIGYMLKTLTLSFLLLSAMTFFVKEIAFSRVVVAATYFLSFLSLVLWRLMAVKNKQSLLGRAFRPKALVVGASDSSIALIEKLMKQPDSRMKIEGIVVSDEKIDKQKIAEFPVLGPISKLTEIISMVKAEIVVFLTHDISYEKIINSMEGLARQGTVFRIVPENLEVLIGKSHVDHLDDLPLVDFNVSYWKPQNRIIKRIFDILSASLLLLFTFPFVALLHLFFRKKKHKFRIRYGKYSDYSVPSFSLLNFSGLKNLLMLLPSIIKGHISWVGAKPDIEKEFYSHIVGITGIVQQQKEIKSDEENLDLEEYYLINYSIGLDLKLFIKWLFKI